MAENIDMFQIHNWHSITCVVFILFGLSHAVVRHDVDDLIIDTQIRKLGCPDNWLMNNLTGLCYLINREQSHTWFEAMDACQKEGGDLASLEGTDTSDFIKTIIWKYIIPKDLIWIGLRWNIETRTFRWTSGDDISMGYPYWSIGNPNFWKIENYSCVGFEPATYMDNRPMENNDCDLNGGYICEKNSSTILPSVVQKCDSGFKRYRETSDCYRQTINTYTWNEGLKTCQNGYEASGARIEGEGLEKFIKDNVFIRGPTSWLNFKYNDSANGYQWMDDFSPVTKTIVNVFNNDNYCGIVVNSTRSLFWWSEKCDDKHYYMICHKSTQGKLDYHDKTGLMDTETLRIQNLVGVDCPDDEWVFNKVTKTCYKLSNETATWVEAAWSCRSMNARLLQIKDSVTLDNFANDFRHLRQLWVGLRRYNDKFIWNDGTPMTYGCVSNDKIYQPNEFCVVVVRKPLKTFRVHDCIKPKRQFMCEYGKPVIKTEMFMVWIKGHQYFLGNESYPRNASQVAGTCTDNQQKPLNISTPEELKRIITWLTNNKHILLNSYWAVFTNTTSKELADEVYNQTWSFSNVTQDAWYRDKINNETECGMSTQCCSIFGLMSKPVNKYYLLDYPCDEQSGFICNGDEDLTDLTATEPPMASCSTTSPTTFQTTSRPTEPYTPSVFTSRPTRQATTMTSSSTDSQTTQHTTPRTTQQATTSSPIIVSAPLTQEETQQLATSINHLRDLTKPKTSCSTGDINDNITRCNTNTTVPQKQPNKMCPCSCGAPGFNPNPSPIELSNILTKIQKALEIPKTNLASKKSKKQSAPDSRTSTHTMGGVVLFMTTFPVLSIMVTDMLKFIRAIARKLCKVR